MKEWQKIPAVRDKKHLYSSKKCLEEVTVPKVSAAKYQWRVPVIVFRVRFYLYLSFHFITKDIFLIIPVKLSWIYIIGS